MQISLAIENLTLAFGGVQALTDVTLDVQSDEILALIGPNGAGKSCILNCISGFVTPQRGRISFNGADLLALSPHRRVGSGIGRTFQGITLMPQLTVGENVRIGRHIRERSNVLADLCYWPLAHREAQRQRRVVDEILELTRLTQYRDTPVNALGYGLRKQVDLARALATEPRLLLMDEPMAGMNSGEKMQMAELIATLHRQHHLPIVLIEHDIEMIMNLADRIAVLMTGRLIALGEPNLVRADPKVIAAYWGTE